MAEERETELLKALVWLHKGPRTQHIRRGGGNLLGAHCVRHHTSQGHTRLLGSVLLSTTLITPLEARRNQPPSTLLDRRRTASPASGLSLDTVRFQQAASHREAALDRISRCRDIWKAAETHSGRRRQPRSPSQQPATEAQHSMLNLRRNRPPPLSPLRRPSHPVLPPSSSPTSMKPLRQ